MTVRDVYIFEGVGELAPDVDCDAPQAQAEAFEDLRYARRLRRAPLLADRPLLRPERVRRSAVLDADVEDAAVDDAVLSRAAFGGTGSLGAALAVIGLLIMAIAWTGPSWGWGGGWFAPASGGFGPGPHAVYAADSAYPDGPDARYAASTFETDSGPFMAPSGAMLAGGTVLVVGLVLLASRRRGYLFG